MHCDFDTLPPRVLTRIFEYLFWTGLCGDHRAEQMVLPIGQFAMLACLSVSHAWRKRAAGLFYRTAVVAVGASDTVMTASGEHRVRTNVRLVLESGYAPKTTRLAVFSIGSMMPEDLDECLVASEFASFEWPSIDTLYFYHPLGPENEEPALRDQDEPIDSVNRHLIASMPNLERIYTLSGTCDSFGLFALDDLINERMPYLNSLTAVAQGPLKLGFHGSAYLLKRLTMSTVDPTLAMHALLTDNDSIASSGEESEDSERQREHLMPLTVPRVFAESLVQLDIGPIEPDNIWSQFFGINGASGNPDIFTAPDFVCLRRLRLVFGLPRCLRASDSRRKARHASRQHASPGPENTVVNGIYPVFPRLESLTVEHYPYNILLFLENFPRARLRYLELRKCPHRFFELSLGVFTSLQTAIIDVPRAPHASKSEDEEAWISCAFAEKMPTLRSLSLVTSSILYQVDLPSQHYNLNQLQRLHLGISMRAMEVAKLLFELPQLRSLYLEITNVMSAAHEYLSRSVHPKKYPGIFTRATLSSSLEELAVRLVDLSPHRSRRALAKTAYAAARIPSILRISTQAEYVDDLRASIVKVQATKLPHVDARHLDTVQLHSLVT
ncbi:hypothetical protein IWW55_000332 [Coemansia sp. RSA 2706]|nr:hypothetical protein IWW55_000332 [Coemansia sp. RSA 2706]KAJ2321524.1 hypothetical protein IWW52_000694 [Coemansia sp. RSA 2704]KAJ2369626.1 hypothetical protein H4S01_000888 [Coemansia sp. RSA 2610]KAJ2392904.1 hypothetical protein H4S02_000525 [Coemansia sp. RSA 2611]KAJ2739520.1 hypothetical protein H4R23_000401 [Coemansia sp. Cherry 401B]